MEFPNSQVHTNTLLSLSTFVHQNCIRFGSELSSRLNDTKRTLSRRFQRPPLPPLASLLQPKQALAAALSSDFVAKTLTGTAVYTVSSSNNEFVLISDPNGAKSIGSICFRQEDAEAFLAQVRLRRKEIRSAAKVVPITLDQVYMLKVEGIAFRFLPDPAQIKNALELKAADVKTGFDGVPVFQATINVERRGSPAPEASWVPTLNSVDQNQFHLMSENLLKMKQPKENVARTVLP